MNSVGVDIGGSHVVSCMFEHTNKHLDHTTWVHNEVDTKAPKNAIIDQWVKTISETIELSGKEIEGVGIAMPGPFDYYSGVSRISDVNKLDGLYGVNIRQELAEKLKFQPSKIRFINDASAFSIAEALVGNASKFQKVVAITLGTGLGSSFLNEGFPLINSDNVPEGGFLYNKLHYGKLSDDVFSTRGLLERYNYLSGQNLSNVKELAERAEKDQQAAEVFHWFGVELGRFLAPYLYKFEAEVLVIGGSISKAHNLFLPGLNQQVKNTEIQISELGEEAAIIGGSLLLQEDFYKTLTPILKLM